MRTLIGASGERRHPFHKPDWSPDYLETFNYIGFPACFRTRMALDCSGAAGLYDFVLRFTERTTKITHIGKILGHSLEPHALKNALTPRLKALDFQALQARLDRTGRCGAVTEDEFHPGCYRIRLELKRSPLVSVIIPTAGKTIESGGRRIDLIKNVMENIRHRSTYNNLEIIVVDNGDLTPEQINMLTHSRCRRVTYTDPVFNISKKLNMGVSVARGELLLLMNDDIEIPTPDWVERFVEHFEKPHVGVVGAKLLYPDGRTQHVGVVYNAGNPYHVRRLFPRDEAGYFFSTCGVRNFSAITGACMMTPMRVYQEVGGYTEALAVNFNDIDYCFKVRKMGLSVMSAPGVELVHMESASRAGFADEREVEWFQNKWAEETSLDPFYNERYLSVEPPTFTPSINKRII